VIDPPDDDVVFESVSNRRLRGHGALAGAVALVLAAVAGFFLALRTNHGPISLHATTTVPMLLAVGLFTSAFVTLRSPTKVILAEQDLRVLRGDHEIGRWRWDQLALAPTGQAAVSQKRVLKLYGDNGTRPLVTLSDDLANFDVMVDAIRRRMAESPSPQRASVALRKARRTGLFLIIGGVLFLALAAVNAWMAIHHREAAELLQSRGAPAQATIVRKFTAPDGHTRRIEYRVDAPAAPTENVEVSPMIWALLRDGQHIPVISVPGRPDISRLAAGQVDDNMQGDPRLMLGISIAVAVMSLIFLAAGVLSRRGLELKWDAARRRPRITRVTETEPQ
jgi:hypothetical protein